MQLIGVSFFLSGFAALIYEILWVRLLALFCGNTTLATSAVLAAYMAGLALGSWLGGRAADRCGRRRLLLVYACLEAGIAVTALLSGPAIRFLGSALPPFGLVNASQGAQSAVYFAAASLVLVLPTGLMGATLPVLTRWAGSDEEEIERPLSLLYGLNTLGAMLGAALAGFAFIAWLGIRKTMLLGTCSNAACALMAFSLWRGRSEDAVPHAPSASSRPPLAWLAAGGLFASGAAAMICEVAWTRAFAQVIGSSTYAFTIMLITILAGLAAGSLLFHASRRRIQAGVLGWGLLFAAIALSVRAALPLFNVLPYGVAKLFALMGRGPAHLHGIQLLLCGSIMAVPTVLMGAVLPWAAAAFRPESGKTGSTTGQYYAANTLGAIAGTVIAGLALVPMLGAERSLAAASWLYACAAVIAIAASPETLPLRLGCAAGAAALMLEAAFVSPAWDARVLSSGMFLYGKFYAGSGGYGAFLKDIHRDKVIFYRDGLAANVAVLESPREERYLRVNGKTDASQGKDMATQLLLGYLPLLMHPGSPRRSLVIWLGSGTSAAALASEPGMEAIDVVEIEPAVTQAAALFEKANRGVLRDPRLRVIHADARQLLGTPGRPYDIISSEPSNPWIAGVAGLYTLEAFESARARLAEDGVFCQWFHSYHMSAEDFRMVMRTFSAAFPHVLLMSNGSNDFFLLGSLKPWNPDFSKLRRFYAGERPLRQNLAATRDMFDHPFTLLASTFLLSDAEVRRMSASARVNLDDLPALEFSAPRFIEHGQTGRIVREIAALKRSLVPEGLRNYAETDESRSLLKVIQGASYLEFGQPEQAETSFREALALDPRSARAQTYLGLLAESDGRDAEAAGRYRKAVASEPGYVKARILLGELCIKRKRRSEGMRQFEAALRIAPANPRASLHLAFAYLEDGRRAQALGLVHAALDRPIADPKTHENLILLLDAAQRAADGRGG